MTLSNLKDMYERQNKNKFGDHKIV